MENKCSAQFYKVGLQIFQFPFNWRTEFISGKD